MEEKKLTDEELKQAFFILRHGSSEGLSEYIKAVLAIENEYNRQKAEIERLTEEKTESAKTAIEVLEKNIELQKQVDELKEERENMQAVIFGLEEDKRKLLKRLDEEFVSLKAVKAGENSPKAMKMLVESVGFVQKETAEKFAERLKQRLKVYLNEDLDFLMKWNECNITIDEIAKEITEGEV